MKLVPFVKTGVLTVLVAISLVLSYLLWQGLWQTQPEIGIVSAVSLPVAQYPTLVRGTAPIRVIYERRTGRPQYAVAVPNTPMYERALHELSGLRVLSLRQVTSLGFTSLADAKAPTTVQIEFGSVLGRSTLSLWLPSITRYALPTSGSSIYLFTDGENQTVQLGITSDEAQYLASTNLSPTALRDLADAAIQSDPWKPVSLESASFAPLHPLTMVESEWSLVVPQKTLLVHSFFTNPFALMNIAEKDNTTIWTDGSRIVWLDEGTNELTYQDPVSTPSAVSRFETAASMSSAVISYVHTHGGGLPEDKLLDDPTDSMPGLVAAYTLRPYIAGYPVLDGSQDESITFEQGHVAQFRRPLARLSVERTRKTVQVMDYNELMAHIRSLYQVVPKDITVDLGYDVKRLSTQRALLRPVYLVSEEGVPVWMLDAVTGRAIKGWNIP
ncbi:MAG: hypothetical protein K6T83_00640 [Alicyclobacillus sp.]|nr:hypothetical protein [Alicyclobacillus sp.]